MADHAWVLENIAGYLADGLDAAERARFENHVADCLDCGLALNEARAVDQKLSDLFHEIRPRVGLEDRMIRGLRSAPLPVRRSSPLFAWAGVGVAAAVMLGFLGAGMAALNEIADGSIQTASFADVGKGKESLEQETLYGMGGGRGAKVATAEDRARASRESMLGLLERRSDGEAKLKLLDSSMSMANDEIGADPKVPTNYNVDRVEEVSVPGPVNLKETIGVPNAPAAESFQMAPPPGVGGKEPRKTSPPSPSAPVGGGFMKDKPTAPSQSYFNDQPAAKENRLFFGDVSKKATEEKLEDKERKSRRKESAGEKPDPEPDSAPPAKNQEGDPKKPADKPAPAAPPKPPAPPSDAPPALSQRKIIRSGDVEFEIDSFDTSVERIAKIAGEEKGFVATVNSDKLQNGKVRGSVVVRVPPDRLDTLLLKLRALGDLKSQRIGSQDVTKAYTDTESRLRAARTMEQRLLEIIKTRKGEIKDLLQAEKNLGEVLRTIEEYEGEMRSLNNLISLSTLTISLTEREIRAAFGITETSHIDLGIEVEDVEKAQQQAHAAIAEAKGRISHSELKQRGVAQYEAIIEFQAAPDAVGPLRERLRQLGEVTRQNVGRLQKAEGGTERALDSKVKRDDVRFKLSLYNLANLNARETVQIQIACLDPDSSYRAVLERAGKASARILTQHLDRQRNDQSLGTVEFEVKTADADAVLTDLKTQGEVMKLKVVENADSQTTTRSKRRFTVQLAGWASSTLAPRETALIQVASRDVSGSYKRLHDTVVKNRTRVLNAVLREQDRLNVVGELEFEIRRADEAIFSTALAGVGDIVSHNIQRTSEAENVIDSKLRWKVTIINQVNIKPRQVTTLAVEVKDVDRSASEFIAAVNESKGRIIDTNVSHERTGIVTAHLIFDVPFDHAAALASKFRDAGVVRQQQITQNPQVPEGELSIARIDVIVSNAVPIVASNDGLWGSIRTGLSFSYKAISWSVILLFIVLPWVALVGGIFWGVRKLQNRSQAASPPPVG